MPSGIWRKGEENMVTKNICSALAMLMALLLVSVVVVPASSTEDAALSSIKDQNNGRELLSVMMTLHNNGAVIVDQKTYDDNTILLKGVEIPKDWKESASKEKKLEPTDEDWAFLMAVMTDISDKERKELIKEVKQTIKGNSKLSKEEQDKILQQIGLYLIQATEGEGNTPKWYGVNGHWQMSTSAGNQLTFVTPAHISTLGDYSGWADLNRDEPNIFGFPIANRHSWVFGEPGIPYADNLGPASCEYFMNRARTDFNQYDVGAAYIDIGKGLHYIEDMGCPFHTSAFYGLAHHPGYESWVSSHWSQLESAMQVDTYYIIGDPSDASEYLAWLSHQKLQPILDIMNTFGWENSPTLTLAMTDHTRELIRETEMMTKGMIMYSAKFESPNTLGENRVPIVDYSTSYAYIDNVACSEKMYYYLYITHTYIGDLEIWLGYKEDSSPTYTEIKVWDRQGGSTDNLALMFNLQGFETTNIHDWRLRIKDSAGGDQGYLEENVIQIG